MRRALILQHMDHDHPGRFLDFFAEDGVIPEFVRVWEDQEIPSLASYDLMFASGGPQDTWEEDKYPWLAMEKQVIREWVLDRAKPFIGMCLGYQLMGAALGGEVRLAKENEMGVCEIDLTEDGQRHPFFAGIDPVQKVLQFHFAEVKRAPEKAVVLASSSKTKIQALAIGTHAMGTQFHCEHSPQTLAGWSSQPDILGYLDRNLGPNAYERLLTNAYPLMPQFNAMTRRLYDNFAKASGLRN